MKYKIITFFVIAIGLILAAGFVFAKIEQDSDNDGLSDYEEKNIYNSNLNMIDTDNDGYKDGQEVFNGYSPIIKYQPLETLELSVPYINEAPDNNWTGPWKNACEEASMAQIENYYLGNREVSIKEAKKFMEVHFALQNKIWGSNADSDAKRTARLINDYTSYNATIKDNPTVAEIKKELQQKRPVISLHYGFDLKNPNIPFVPLPRGTSYHMMVIIGYDDTTQEFITNDTGDRKTGKSHRYDYELFIDSLHDYDFNVRKANGPARVLFTYPKLAKIIGDPKVYYLKGTEKQWIVDEKTFNAKGYKWEAINVAEKEWLDNFVAGPDIKI
ncbi:C39 family peptidase [Candidatus Falkowbacteria bacterium]|nr:C39 family peptidase [Candidatus Falkowbacteria bacterium]